MTRGTPPNPAHAAETGVVLCCRGVGTSVGGYNSTAYTGALRKVTPTGTGYDRDPVNGETAGLSKR
ncbi:hypothetical protein DNL40_00660 [Xylanimonas oleitrophica]|uniref:Uncharacterized protein n=1 Tax=Xylanimonas oleitrophica TaxID=2607479 RepID=A0A2W5Y8S9_9MICO|nr:hypothetical protein [Xylanimonas oleitrophica]PZR54944.1 hypothetical protein DNL40_00660 [Xylanimonas oleitrophica]